MNKWVIIAGIGILALGGGVIYSQHLKTQVVEGAKEIVNEQVDSAKEGIKQEIDKAKENLNKFTSEENKEEVKEETKSLFEELDEGIANSKTFNKLIGEKESQVTND